MITPLYAALLALFFVFLSFTTIKQRVKSQVGIGSGTDPLLERKIRVHANFAEYIPLCLLLMYFVEQQIMATVGSNSKAILWVHLIGVLLLIGRLLHAFGVSQLNEKLIYRQSGMAITFTVIIASSVYLMLGRLFV